MKLRDQRLFQSRQSWPEKFRQFCWVLAIGSRESEAEDAAHALCALVESHGVGDRVLVASFHQAPIDAFRARCPGVATAATRRLFDAGVSGITPARPDHVLALLGRLRGAREAAPVP